MSDLCSETDVRAANTLKELSSLTNTTVRSNLKNTRLDYFLRSSIDAEHEHSVNLLDLVLMKT